MLRETLLGSDHRIQLDVTGSALPVGKTSGVSKMESTVNQLASLTPEALQELLAKVQQEREARQVCSPQARAGAACVGKL